MPWQRLGLYALYALYDPGDGGGGGGEGGGHFLCSFFFLLWFYFFFFFRLRVREVIFYRIYRTVPYVNPTLRFNRSNAYEEG